MANNESLVHFDCGRAMRVPGTIQMQQEVPTVPELEGLATMEHLTETLADARLATRRLERAGIIGAVPTNAMLGIQLANF